MFTITREAKEGEWRDFLRAHAPHSFLTSWEWGVFHQETGHDIVRYVCRDAEQIVGLCLAIRIQAKRGDYLLIPHGPILDSSVPIPEALRVFTDAWKQDAQRFHSACIRVCPLWPDTSSTSDAFSQLTYRSAPTHVHPERSWMLRLDPSEEELMANMRKTSRQAIRKALEAGVHVRFSHDSKDIDVFYDIYRATVARQQFTPFSRSYLGSEVNAFLPKDRVFVAIASVEGQDVSSAFIVMDERNGYYHHGASTQAFPKISASHALQWEIIKELKRRGCSWYNFWGVVAEDQTSHPWYGLSVFKRGFGGQEETYQHAQDLPLTWRYWPMRWIEDLRRRKRRL